MNRLFAGLVERHVPKFNPLIMDGLACHMVPGALAYLDGIFRSAAKSFPKGLVYEGCERCTPREEYAEATKVRNNKRLFDLAESDVFLIKLKFTFEDETGRKEQIPDRYLYLPFVNEAGIFRSGGTMYHITGVLSDRVISPGTRNLFVRLIRDRLIFQHVGHSVMVNNNRDTFNVVWSGIYRKNQRDIQVPRTTQALSCVAHYLFAKMGFTEAFRRYLGFVPIAGHLQHTGPLGKPDSVICQSSYYGIVSKPAAVMSNHYKPSDLYLLIPKEHWNPSTAAFVAGFFYVVDHFPERFTADRLDSPFLWSVLLGHVIFSGSYSEAKLYERITDHFESLDDYLDGPIKEKLREIGWELDTFYDLIAMIMMRFPELLLGSKIDTNSMYSKHIEILYYLLFPIIAKIFKVIYHLRKPKIKKPLTANTIREAFNKNMTTRIIFRVGKNKMIAEPVSFCGDHKFPKLTSKITEQEAGSNRFGKKPQRVQLNESHHINASMVECGNVLFLSKANPKPDTRLNPFLQIDPRTGALIRNPAFIEELDLLQRMLTQTGSVDPEDIPAEPDVGLRLADLTDEDTGNDGDGREDDVEGEDRESFDLGDDDDDE